jgi:fucose permease
VPDDQRRTSIGWLLKDKVFLVSLAAIFLAGATELGMAQWLPAYTETALGYPKWMGGIALVAFSAAMALGRIAAGILGSRFSATSLMITGCCASFVLFLIACFSPWPAVALAGCVLAGFAGSSLWPSMLAATADRFPHGGATMFGLLAAFGNAGGIFMPWGVGAVADHSSMRLGLSSAAICPLLMAACLWWMLRKQADGTAGQIATPLAYS